MMFLSLDWHLPLHLSQLMEFIFVLNVVYVGCKVVAQGGL